MTLEALRTVERIAARSKPDGDCWTWTGAKVSGGYGMIRTGSKVALTHRVSWEAHRGPIPDSLVLDHQCNNPACWNPDHLNPVTREVNSRRKHWSPLDEQGRVVACRNGHPKTPGFVRVERDGRRACRGCQRDRAAKARSNA